FRLPREMLPHRARWTTGLQILLAPTADFPHRHIFATEKSKIGQLSPPNEFSNPFRAHIEEYRRLGVIEQALLLYHRLAHPFHLFPGGCASSSPILRCRPQSKR